jgi:hypothetical protein
VLQSTCLGQYVSIKPVVLNCIGLCFKWGLIVRPGLSSSHADRQGVPPDERQTGAIAVAFMISLLVSLRGTSTVVINRC